jgi:hypothetical protein
MSYQVIGTEYLEINNTPMSTPAWRILDHSELNNGPELRGSNLTIPRHRGQLAQMRYTDSRTVSLPIAIFSDKTPFGDNPFTTYGVTTYREALFTNIQWLKSQLTFNPTTDTRTFTAIFHRGATLGDLQAEVQPSVSLDIQHIGLNNARGVLTLTFPEGVWRTTGSLITTTGTVAASTTATFNIQSDAEVLDATIQIPGAANSLTILNNANGCSISYPHAITSSGITINCGAYTAQDGATEVGGKILTTGTPLWLPLVPYNNQLVVTRPGGSSVTMTFSYRGVYL